MSAGVLVRVDNYGRVRVSSLRLADEADDALVFQRRIGRAGVSALVGQLHHLVLIDQLFVGQSSVHCCAGVLDAHSCGADEDVRDEQGSE